MRNKNTQRINTDDSGQESDTPLQSRTTKRRLLKRLGAAGVALTGIASIGATAGSAQIGGAPSWYENSHREGNWEVGGSTSSMDIAVVDMTSDGWGHKAGEVYNGVQTGLSVLHDECWWFDGYRVSLYGTDHNHNGGGNGSALASSLDDVYLTQPKHYLVVFNGGGSVHAHTSGTIWGSSSREITGLSLSTTRDSPVPALVRGLHQAMHSYIDGDVAMNMTGEPDAYDAAHALGGAQREFYPPRRTVMADAYGGVMGSAIGGSCADAVHAEEPQQEEHIGFSDCTKSALQSSR